VKCLISDRWAKLNLIREIVATHWNGRHRERWTYRFVNDVLLRDSADVLSVNWCEIIIVREDTQAPVYHNTFITDHRLTDQSVAPIVASGQLEDRKREPQHPQESWVSSRTQFRPWPTALSCPAAQPQPPGVSLAHCADPDDAAYQQIRHALGARRTFFDDIRTLTRCIYFESWAALLAFMFHGLELDRSL
jgi:hypothetical protein